jgi:hypothetical protein
VPSGGERPPTTGLCALLPAPLACGAVDGIVDAATVSGNQRGIVVQELDEGSSGTVPVLYGNMIKGNAGVGLYVYTSHVVPDPLNGRVINENLIGHNGFSDATCTSAEAASQVVFDGPVAASAAVVTQCAGASTVTACNSTPGLLCVWNPYRASNNCQPSYRIGNPDCSDTNSNTITGYCRGCIGNADLRSGIVAVNGAWVNASNVHWITNSFEANLDWYADEYSYVATAGLVCLAAAVQCP